MNRSHPPKNQASHFRELLNDNRDRVLVFLNTQLNTLFGNTDEVLLDFAEQAESDAVQGRFFEAMGAVRKKGADIENVFRREINDAFDRFGQSRFTDDVRGADDAELSLIEPEEMEESVAAENIVNRAETQYYSQLYALRQRLTVINQGRKMEERDIPAGPTQLVNAYRAALTQLEIDVKAKIVLYALFDKFVMRQLKEMYDEFSSNLKNEGILPNLKPLFRRSKGGGHAAKGEAAKTDKAQKAEVAAETHKGGGAPPHPSQSLGEELLDAIMELMSHSHQAARPAGGGPAVKRRAISAIDAIQPPSLRRSGGVMSDLENLPQLAMAPGFVEEMKATVQAQWEQVFAEVGGRENMDDIDADTIDLVGMLFEYMLTDPLLPNLAKALLSHLHTPYLKLALLDRNMLVDDEHSARLLLDRLVEAGGEWVFENDVKRGIFPHMQTVVDRVLNEFRDNVELFPELLDYFSTALEEVKRKAEAVEHRAQESAQGKEKLQVAKKHAVNEMESRVQQARMPKSAREFLLHSWADRLVFILLRHPMGDQSEEWIRALRVADDLVWLFQPKTTESKRKGMVRVCNLLRDEIQNGLETLGGYHQHHVDELFALLRDPKALVDWEGEAGVAPHSEPAVPKSEPIQPLPSAAQTAAGEDKLSKSENDMLEKLQKLEFGTWFEFKGEGDAPPRRLKLSWLSPPTSTGMFVDPSGLQAEVKSLTELSRMLVTGKAKVIPRPKHPFVERALLVIKRTLQRKTA